MFLFVQKSDGTFYVIQMKKGGIKMEIGSIIKDALTPELYPLIIVIYLIGKALKHTEKLNDRYIPVTLGCISFVINALYVFANVATVMDPQHVIGYILTALIQGVLIAGGAVYFDQVYKQGTAKG